MSTVDLERLIVRQVYFIPVQSQKLRTAILNELGFVGPNIYSVDPWHLAEEHKLSFEFEYDLKYAFLFGITYGMDLKARKCKELCKEKSKEFDELGEKAFVTELEKVHSNLLCMFTSLL